MVAIVAAVWRDVSRFERFNRVATCDRAPALIGIKQSLAKLCLSSSTDDFGHCFLALISLIRTIKVLNNRSGFRSGPIMGCVRLVDISSPRETLQDEVAILPLRD